MINAKDFTPAEILALCERAMAVMSATDHICGSTSINDQDLHMTNVENSRGEIGHLLNFLEKQLGDIKTSIGSVKAMDKDLGRHFDRTKRAYWLNKNNQPSLS